MRHAHSQAAARLRHRPRDFRARQGIFLEDSAAAGDEPLALGRHGQTARRALKQ